MFLYSVMVFVAIIMGALSDWLITSFTTTGYRLSVWITVVTTMFGALCWFKHNCVDVIDIRHDDVSSLFFFGPIVSFFVGILFFSVTYVASAWTEVSVSRFFLSIGLGAILAVVSYFVSLLAYVIYTDP